jgi:hypothetical protein
MPALAPLACGSAQTTGADSHILAKVGDSLRSFSWQWDFFAILAGADASHSIAL